MITVVFAQILLVFTPEPMAVLRAMYGDGIDEMGMWSVRGCSTYERSVSIDAQRIYMAGQRLGLVSKDHAILVLERRVKETPASFAMRTLAIVSAAGTVAMAAIATQEPTKARSIATGAFGLMIPISTYIGKELEREVPRVDHGEILDGVLRLDPLGCFSSVVFARRRPQVEIFSTSVEVQ